MATIEVWTEQDHADLAAANALVEGVCARHHCDDARLACAITLARQGILSIEHYLNPGGAS